MSIDSHIGRKIRARRAALGLTQEDLAVSIDVSYQQLQKYEAGANRIPASRLYHISQRLAVPTDHFFEGYDTNSQPEAEHGARIRAVIDAVGEFGKIRDTQVKLALSGLIKAVVAHQEARGR